MDSQNFVSPSFVQIFISIIKKFVLILLACFLSSYPIFASTESGQDSISVQQPDSLSSSTKPPVQRVIPVKMRKDSVLFFSQNLNEKQLGEAISRHVGDYVKRIPGASVIDLVSAGLPVYSRLRGSSIQQTTVAIDGMPINHDQFGPIDISLLPIEAFSQVEVSYFDPALMNPNTSGTINIKTPDFNLKKPLTTIAWRKGYYGKSEIKDNYGDSEVDVEFGQRIAANSAIIGAVTYQSSNGKYSHSLFDAQKTRFQITSLPTPNWYFKYQLFQTRSDVDLPTPVDWQSETSDFHQKSNYFIHLLDIRGNVTSDSMEDIRIRTYYNSLYQDFTDSPKQIKDKYRNRFAGIHVQGYFPFRSNLVTYAAKSEYRWIRSNQIRKAGFFNGNLFLHSAFSTTPTQEFNWYGSLEVNDQFGIFFAPALKYVFNIQHNLKLAFGYQQTRRLPNFYELHWNNSDISGNPKLSAEKLQQADINFNTKTNKTSLNSTFFLKQVDNPITLVENISDSNSVTFQNSNSEIFSGYEHIIEYFPVPKFSISSHFSVIFKEKLNSVFFVNYPQFSKQFTIGYENMFFENNLAAKIKLITTILGNRWTFSGGNYVYPAYFFSDTVVFHKWEPVIDILLEAQISSFNFQLALENIFSREYQFLHGYPERQMSIWMNLNWHFLD